MAPPAFTTGAWTQDPFARASAAQIKNSICVGEHGLPPKRVEQALQDFIESAPDAMVIVDAAGQIVMVNSQTERLFGYPRQKLLMETVDELVPERFRGRHAGHRQGFFSDPRVRPMGAGLELFGLRADGEEFPVEISLSPIETDGRVLVSSAIRDITERKRFEKTLREKNVELENASLAKDRFLASMSHELRTPLNAIIGFTGTLLMKLPGPLTDEQERQLKIVQSSARHLLSLINDVLDIAKIESGKVELRYEAVSISEVVHEVISALHSMAEEKGLRLEFTTGDVAMLQTDQRALHQIMLNLVQNAIKYTPSGSVRIDVSRNSDKGDPVVSLRVIDTGVGIKEEDQPRLFRRFEQLDSSGNRSGGVGLGLYLCERLASLLGGRLSVTSAFGKGSTFTLTLPEQA